MTSPARRRRGWGSYGDGGCPRPPACRRAPPPRAFRRTPMRHRVRRTVASSWLLGAVVALVTWPVGSLSVLGERHGAEAVVGGANITPAGIDASTRAAQYMAAHEGLHFGSQVMLDFG